MSVGSDRMPNSIPGAIGLKFFLGREGVVADEQRVISVDPNGTLSQPITLPGVYTAIDGSNKTVGWIVANIDPISASTQPTSPEEIVGELKNASIISGETNLRIVSPQHQAIQHKGKTKPTSFGTTPPSRARFKEHRLRFGF